MPILKPIRAIQLNKLHPLARGLVGFWLFNESGGNKVFDLSGSGNTGSLVGDTHFVPGKYGACLNFDGSGDYVNVAHNDNFTNNNAFSYLLWFYLQQLQSSVGHVGICVDNLHSASPWRSWWLRIAHTDDKLYAGIYNNSETQTTSIGPTAVAGKWYQAVVTFDGTTQSLYVDGILADSDNITGTLFQSDSVFRISREGASGPNGLIDHVMIFNRALTAGEIALLYREPFCMFAVSIQPNFLFPAGQIVLLVAASTATSSAHGLLTKHSKLAGIIDAGAALCGILTWHYRWPVERRWLVEALFDGMTANAFKLGTVLTGGWFWMRWSGCSALYRGPSMEQIDFANISTVAEQDAGSISPPDYLPHHSNLSYFYVVRRFNNCGYQERTLTAAVKVSIDADGNLAEPQPNNIFAWRLDQVHSNKIQLLWFYCPLEQESQPVYFKVYYDSGMGQIDYENPIATVNYQGRKFYTYQSDALAAGRYLFVVRTEDAAGIENNSLSQLGIQLSTNSPDAINILSAEVV